MSAGLLVVDPIREHQIEEKTFKFWGPETDSTSTTESCFIGEVDGYAKARFITELTKQREQLLPENFGLVLQEIIADIVSSDTSEILYSFHDALDDIDLSLSQDEVIRTSLGLWRDRFGHWKQELLHLTISVKHMSRALEHQRKITNHPFGSSSPNVPRRLETDLGDLRIELEDALKRLNSTFQAVMSTMSILESQKAILEAETVTKLTSLAFFFIPLSFVATVFGMNVVVSCVSSFSPTTFYSFGYLKLTILRNSTRSSKSGCGSFFLSLSQW